MPKIVIREYDKTKAGTSNYTNFTVVVPGFTRPRTFNEQTKTYNYGGKSVYVADTNEDEGTSILDDNYIYECSYSV